MLDPLEKKFFGDEVSCRLKNSAFQAPRLNFKRFSGLFILSGVVSALALVAFFAKYLWTNWAELSDVSSGRPFWERVGAWVRHYFRMDPAVVGEGSRTPQRGSPGRRSSPVVATPTNEVDSPETVQDAVNDNPLREAEARDTQEPPVELHELRRTEP